MEGSARLQKIIRRREEIYEITAREDASREEGLMVQGMTWNPTLRLRIREQVQTSTSLEDKWKVLAKSYDLKTNYAFSEYTGEVFVVGVSTLSDFSQKEEDESFERLSPLMTTVRHHVRRWIIENNTASNNLITLAWKACLIIDLLSIYWKQDALVKAPLADRQKRWALPINDAGEGIPVMQYTQSQCMLVIQQITNCWNTLSLDRDDYDFVQLLRFRFAVICFLVFSEEQGVMDIQGMREPVSPRPGDDGIVDQDAAGSGILYQASDPYVERGIAFFADAEKAFHLRNSLRVLYQQIDSTGTARKPRGLRNAPPLSKDARSMFDSWFSSALRSPQQNQWRSDFVTKFACALLRPGMRSMYYDSNRNGAAPVIFEAVQGVISPEGALSDLYPTENQQAIDMFQSPKSMLDITKEPDHPITTWVKESAILYVWNLTISQFAGVPWKDMWRQLDFVDEAIPYVVHKTVSAAPYRILRNANTFYIYRSSDYPEQRIAYLCSDVVMALHTWLTLNINLPIRTSDMDLAKSRCYTFTPAQNTALKAFYKTVFVDGAYVENYKPVPTNPYKKVGINDQQFAKKA